MDSNPQLDSPYKSSMRRDTEVKGVTRVCHRDAEGGRLGEEAAKALGVKRGGEPQTGLRSI